MLTLQTAEIDSTRFWSSETPALTHAWKRTASELDRFQSYRPSTTPDHFVEGVLHMHATIPVSSSFVSFQNSSSERTPGIFPGLAPIPVRDLCSKRYALTHGFSALLQSLEGSYVASFLEGNINASGETPSEALDNLRSLIVELYEDYRNHPDEKLGPGPTRQYAALKEILDELPPA